MTFIMSLSELEKAISGLSLESCALDATHSQMISFLLSILFFGMFMFFIFLDNVSIISNRNCTKTQGHTQQNENLVRRVYPCQHNSKRQNTQ
jgi:hypothetical protein